MKFFFEPQQRADDLKRLERGENNSYESFSELSFREYKRDEAVPDNTNILVVPVDKGEDVMEKIMAKFRGSTDRYYGQEYWWLTDYWREKGLPKEQIVIEGKTFHIDLYNFGEPLEPQYLYELERAIRFFARIKGDNPLARVKFILLDDKDQSCGNMNIGGDLNGESFSTMQGIAVYPAGRSFRDHRVRGVSNWGGTIIHELSHHVGKEVYNLWKKEFGWRFDPENKRKISNSTAETGWTGGFPDEEKDCVTNYASVNPSEDICESLVAAWGNQAVLDQKRLRFIQEEFFGGLSGKEHGDNNEEISSISIVRKQGQDITLPRVGKQIAFCVIPPLKFRM